jgi:hypothetical protein
MVANGTESMKISRIFWVGLLAIMLFWWVAHSATSVDNLNNVAQVSSGTYTPVLTAVANVSASTAYVCQYSRVGSMVFVSGRADIDPTLIPVATQLGVSLPVASNFSSVNQCGGTGVSTEISGQASAIYADSANDRAQLEFTAIDPVNRAMYFTFSYLIQ